MTPWSLSTRRRHSFLPTVAPGTLPSFDPTPASPDSINPIVHSPVPEPGNSNSAISLDGGRRASPVKEPGMLAVPEASTMRHGGRKRLSGLLLFKTKSDSHLSTTARKHAEEHPAPADPSEMPAIVKTAPTQDDLGASKRRSTFLLPKRPRTPKRSAAHHEPESQMNTPRVTFDTNDGAAPSSSAASPMPGYEEAAASQLTVPGSRKSESSRSDGSSGDHTIYGQTTTVTQTTHTTTTFFKLGRRKKDKGSLFPLPPRSQAPSFGMGNTPNLSTSSGFAHSGRNSFQLTPDAGTPTGSPRRSRHHSPSRSMPAATPKLTRSDSRVSTGSGQSNPNVSQKRGRSSTAGSHRRSRREGDGAPTPPLPTSSTRTSTSTVGRPSLAGIFNLSRLRQASEPGLRNGISTAPATPMSTESNPLAAPPKSPTIHLPERQEGDTAAKYLARLEEVFSRGALVPVLSKTDDEFMRNVLRSYMRRFKFFEEPLDMAVRKLLMQIELPKETQQIDRTLQSFADRYHECNPGIFQSPDEAYFIAFSILILHTDVFNKNNKRKMQKNDYLKNTQSQGVAPEILECFYDNVSYTPFIHLDDDTEFIAERLMTSRRKVGLKPGGIKSASTTSLRRQGQPVDPYALILEGKLDTLRVPVEEVIAIDDPFSYLGTAKTLNHAEVRRAFFKTGVIQILSSRSRPDAFSNQATIHNPSVAQVGVIDIRVTKVGILWRKDPKKRKTRSPWQEWGVVLTGSQLYFFRNKDWVKSLVHQYENHIKAGRGRTACVFKPPIENFKPDFLISTEQMVALVDSQYKRHKYAFVVSRENIYQEVLLADNETELNDWLAKINYLAAFRTSGVRMRGVGSGSSSEARPSTRPDSTASKETGAEIDPKPRADDELAQQIAQARRQILAQRLEDMADKMVAMDKVLDSQLRMARHLTVLTPIQERTRHDVLTAAAKLSAKLRWERMNRWRVRCHRDILHVDLDEDLKSINGVDESKEEEPSTSTPGKEGRSRLPFPRFNSKAALTPSRQANKDAKPSILSPNTTTKFMNNVEEMFKTPSRGASKQHRRGSWELPPLTFDRRGSGGTAVTGATGTTTSENTGKAPEAEQSQNHVNEIKEEEEPKANNPNEDIVSGSDDEGEHEEEEEEEEEQEHEEEDLRTPIPMHGDSEDKQLKPPSVHVQPSDFAKAEDDAISTAESEVSTTPRPKRHSLQQRLHSSHSMTYHRNRKHRESSSTINTSDDGNNLAPPEEVLVRSPGSFTLHGKKASVITFGSEWQAMSGEEGLKARKATLTGDGDLPSAEMVRRIAEEEAAREPVPIKTPDDEVTNTPKAEFVDAREDQVEENVAGSKTPVQTHTGELLDVPSESVGHGEEAATRQEMQSG